MLRFDSDTLERLLCWSQITEYLITELSMQRELDDDFEWMQSILRSNLFFKVPATNVEQVFSRMSPVTVNAGTKVIQQGDIGDCCYFLKEGVAEVHVSNESPTNDAQVLAELHAGRCFGEDALVNDKPRNASIVMKTDGVLMKLEKNDFHLLLKEPEVDELDESEIQSMSELPIYIDVRTDDEYSLGHLALSANIPLKLLSLKKRLLAMEKPYILYCDSGRRSRAAAYLLGKEGYNVVAMRAGYHGQKLSENLVKECAYILRDGELVATDKN